MKDIKYHLLSLLVTALVAGSFLSSAELSGVVNPFSLTLLRFLLAALMLLPFILIRPQRVEVAKRVFPRSLLMSLFFSVFFICMFEALNTTTPLNTGTLYTLVPFITALAGSLIFKQRLSLKLFGVYILAAVGTCWVVAKGELSVLLALGFNQGDFIFLLGCISMVFFSVSMKMLNRGEESLVTVFCILVGGIIWMTLALIVFQQPLGWSAITIGLAAHMMYLAFFATLVSTYIIHTTTVVLGPTKVMAYIYLSPVFVAIIMFIFKGQHIPIAVYPGIILSVVCTILLQVFNRRT
ncbi:MAG: DMT family transporter [Photobacterium frigidiphilum]|uniref:DMT family transporter n=1 Tax=Photobacterium frigidiphilum TaxID=264736 RepID=UPI003001C942